MPASVQVVIAGLSRPSTSRPQDVDARHKAEHDDERSHDPLPHPPPDPDAFPQLSRGEPADARRRRGAGGAERRRQDQLHRGDLVSVARDAACAAPRWRMSPTIRATAPGRSPPRSRARSALPRSAPASMRRAMRPAATSRRCRIDREPVTSAAAFGDHLRMVWLTPSMDGLFLGAASERRRFFDRLVLAIDSEHSSRVSALERSLRSRNRLLEVRNYDDHWCDAIERETAELAVAVAATRGQTVTRLAAMLRAARAKLPRFRRRRSCSTAGWRMRWSTSPRPRWRIVTAKSCAPAARATPRQAARWTARTPPTWR